MFLLSPRITLAHQVKKVCQAMKASGPEGLQIPILEFGRTVRKFVMLSAADAFDMVEEVAWLNELMTMNGCVVMSDRVAR